MLDSLFFKAETKFHFRGYMNLLKPAGYVMHQQFNIQQFYALPTLYLCICLRTNSNFCHLHHKLSVFYNRD